MARKILISQVRGNRSLSEQTGKMFLPKNVFLKRWIELSPEKPEFIPHIFVPSQLDVSSG